MKISSTRIYQTTTGSLQVVPAGNLVARKGRYPSLSMSSDGSNSVLEWTAGQSKDNSGKNSLGKRIKFSDLPSNLQKRLRRRLKRLA